MKKIPQEYLEEEYSFQESIDSLRHEKLIASIIKHKGEDVKIKASRPQVGPSYSDVLVSLPILDSSGKRRKSWIEVKMNSSDNLVNFRLNYHGGKWTSAEESAYPLIKLIQKDKMVNNFIKLLSEFSGIPVSDITLGKVSNSKGYIDPITMKAFFSQPGVPDKYFFRKDNFDIGEMVSIHYLSAKSEPAHYMQMGKRFFMFDDSDPLLLNKANRGKIPLFAATGTIRLRIAFGKDMSMYEIVPEVKLKAGEVPSSNFNILDDDADPFNKLILHLEKQMALVENKRSKLS